jgi:hypothetical protein
MSGKGLREGWIRAQLYLLNNLERGRKPAGRWPRSAVAGRVALRSDDTEDSERSPPAGPRNACTNVQVFHRQYRENEAKTVAKIETQ